MASTTISTPLGVHSIADYWEASIEPILKKPEKINHAIPVEELGQKSSCWRKEAGDSQETIHSISINSTRTSVNRPKQILAALNSRIWKLAGDIGSLKKLKQQIVSLIQQLTA